MNRKAMVGILAAGMTLGFVSTQPLSARDRDRDDYRDTGRDSRRGRDQALSDVLASLRQARQELFATTPDPDRDRARGLEQVQYAIEQVHAAMGRDFARDRDDRAEDRRAAGRYSDRREDTDARLRAAARHLRDARERIRDMDGDRDGRLAKASEFIDEALKNVRAQGQD